MIAKLWKEIPILCKSFSEKSETLQRLVNTNQLSKAIGFAERLIISQELEDSKEMSTASQKLLQSAQAYKSLNNSEFNTLIFLNAQSAKCPISGEWITRKVAENMESFPITTIFNAVSSSCLLYTSPSPRDS